MFAPALVQSDGITLSDVISDIPHDGPAIVVYVMLLVFVGLIVAGSRRRQS